MLCRCEFPSVQLGTLAKRGASGSSVDEPIAPRSANIHNKVPWSGTDGSTLIAVLRNGLASEPSLRKKRRLMQNYRTCIELYTEVEWEALQSTTVSAISKRSLIIQKLVDLGGRCLTEPTKKLASTMFGLLSEPSYAELTSDERYTGKKLFVFELNREIKRREVESVKMGRPDPPAPAVYFEILPSAIALKSDYPELWRSIFPTQEPVSCKLDENKLERIDHQLKCRGKPSDCLTLAIYGVPRTTAATPDPMSKFVATLENMQASQMRIMELAFGSSNRDSQPKLEGLRFNSEFNAPPRPRRCLTFFDDDGGGTSASSATLDRALCQGQQSQQTQQQAAEEKQVQEQHRKDFLRKQELERRMKAIQQATARRQPRMTVASTVAAMLSERDGEKAEARKQAKTTAIVETTGAADTPVKSSVPSAIRTPTKLVAKPKLAAKPAPKLAAPEEAAPEDSVSV